MFSGNNNQKNIKKETAAGSGLLNIIGAGTKIKGDLMSEGDFRVDGSIEGEVSVRQRLVLGEGGNIVGDIEARDATIAGHLKGNIHVHETLILKPSARIDGDISTNKIIIESGAAFNGRCSMNISVNQQSGKPAGNVTPTATKPA